MYKAVWRRYYKWVIDIEGFEGVYQITEDGQVWSCPRLCVGGTKRQPIGGKFMKLHKVAPHKINCEYVYVDLYSSSKRKREYVHRLVAKAFLPNPNNLPEVNHKNYIRSDNRLANLEWMSKVQNMRHGLLHRKTAIGERASHAKMTEKQVLEIRAHALQGVPRFALAARYSMSYSGIKAIVRRETWRHI